MMLLLPEPFAPTSTVRGANVIVAPRMQRKFEMTAEASTPET